MKNEVKSLTYKGVKLSVQRGSFYTEVKNGTGEILGRARKTQEAIKQAKDYIKAVEDSRTAR